MSSTVPAKEGNEHIYIDIRQQQQPQQQVVNNNYKPTTTNLQYPSVLLPLVSGLTSSRNQWYCAREQLHCCNSKE
eukprot:6491092-Amphidinium_carterae.2